MASKIRVLSDHTINKIAAGEVIENPSSVVKELVENSIDAGSTEISIEIQGGGRQMIRISDDGCGMNADDALLCLERHATSKLREVEDIHTLFTMGFRGEAIPSIASISKFHLLTCPAPENSSSSAEGTMVIVDGGKLISCNPAVRSQGTTIEVSSLFFNVPVRKKFLKSPSIDTNEILKVVSLIALGNPEIKFQLISDGKTLLTAPPSKDSSFSEQLKTRIKHVLGEDFSKNTLLIEDKIEGISIQGVIGEPSYNRHNRTGQYLFINKRGVVSPLVAYAVKDGFGTSIPTGRFPVFALHLTLSGDLVDVNVHPQKREVRLRQEQIIKDLIIKAVRASISKTGVFSYSYDMPQVSPVFAEALQSQDRSYFQEVPNTWVFQPKVAFKAEEKTFNDETTHPKPYYSTSSFQKPFGETYEVPKPISHFAPSLSFSSKELPLRVLTTIPSFIIIDGTQSHSFLEKGVKNSEKGGLILIDQKGAHSRILFEKLQYTHSQTEMAQQGLLIPHTIELSLYESKALKTVIPYLHKMGILIEEFGTNTFVIDSIPQIFGNSNLDQLITDIIHDIRSQTDHIDEQIFIREQAKKIALAATRASISFQKKLSFIEAQTLLDQLTGCQEPYFCPSGKTLLAHLTADELAKLFQK